MLLKPRGDNNRTASVEDVRGSRFRRVSLVATWLGLVLVAAACSPSNDRTSLGPAPVPDPRAAQPEITTVSRSSELVGCMRARGWDVKEDGTGLEFTPLSDAQEAARLVDLRECDGTAFESGEGPNSDRVRAIDVIESSYRERRLLTRCLVENGYPVPEVPSWDTFLDTWMTGAEEDVWSPLARLHDERRAGNRSLIEAALVDCVGEGEEH